MERKPGQHARDILRSAWIWVAVSLLMVFWFPLLVLIRLTDRDPVRYRTGRWFRRLGVAMTRVNPFLHLDISGYTVRDPRRPYVVVSNHQSLADIPLISHLPWEMKWVGKKELFRVPFAGWMMRLAGDISLDRQDPRSGARALLNAASVLKQKCSVMFFPEGTRSADARIGRFNDGAFHLALRSRVPILPLVVDGSHGCLPKKSWLFKDMHRVTLLVLPPVETEGMSRDDAPRLREKVRGMIVDHLAHLRGADPADVDRLAVREAPTARSHP
ncbi:MAG: lysophospholipid acyltransferase family protein [Bacteroidota bacterium]